MNVVAPSLAASLAVQIYEIENALGVKALVARPEFSSEQRASNTSKLLTASVGTRLINTRDAFGVCARGGGQYANDVFLIFRGTTARHYGADWITDARSALSVSSTGAMVHAGFNQVFNSLVGSLAEFLVQQTNIHTIHCIGHSLGGAVANLAADWLTQRYGSKVKLYTFGAPRVGHGVGGFARQLTNKAKPDNIYRAYHRADPVPMVPLFPFMHAPTSGLSYYLPSEGILINFSAHKMDRYLGSVKGQSWQSLYRPEPSFVADIKSWLQQDTAESPYSATFWEKLNQAAVYVLQAIGAHTVQPLFVAGLTVADNLAILLIKGVKLANDVSQWVFLFIRKMMRMLGMKVVEGIEALTEQLIRMVLNKVMRKIYGEVQKALRQL